MLNKLHLYLFYQFFRVGQVCIYIYVTYTHKKNDKMSYSHAINLVNHAHNIQCKALPIDAVTSLGLACFCTLTISIPET